VIIDFLDDTKTELKVIAPSVWRNMLETLPALYWDRRNLCWKIHASWPGYLSVFNTFNGKIDMEISEDVKNWITSLYQNKIYRGYNLRMMTEPGDSFVQRKCDRGFGKAVGRTAQCSEGVSGF
jgi:hypothetical protein